jgi:hypothetical protein
MIVASGIAVIKPSVAIEKTSWWVPAAAQTV